MKDEPLIVTESKASMKSSSKNRLLEEYQIKKKHYIKQYGYVDKDQIHE